MFTETKCELSAIIRSFGIVKLACLIIRLIFGFVSETSAAPLRADSDDHHHHQGLVGKCVGHFNSLGTS